MDVVVTKKLRLFFITAANVFFTQEFCFTVKKEKINPPQPGTVSAQPQRTASSKKKELGDAVVFSFPEQRQIQLAQKKLTIENLENIKKLLKIFQIKIAALKKQQEQEIRAKESLQKEVQDSKKALAVATVATQLAASIEKESQNFDLVPLQEVSLEPLLITFTAVVDTVEELLKMLALENISPIQELDFLMLDKLFERFDSEMQIKKTLQQEITKLIGQDSKQRFAIVTQLLSPLDELLNLTRQLDELDLTSPANIDLEEVKESLSSLPLISQNALNELTKISELLTSVNVEVQKMPVIIQAASFGSELEPVIDFFDQHVFVRPEIILGLSKAVEEIERSIRVLVELNIDTLEPIDLEGIEPLFTKIQALQEEIDSLKNKDDVEDSTFDVERLGLQKNIEDLQAELETKNEEVQTLEEKVENLQNQFQQEQADKQRELDDLEREKSQLQTQLRTGEESARALETERQKTQSLSKEKEQIQMQAQSIQGQAQGMYAELQRLGSANQALTAQLQQLSSYLQAFSQENNQLKQLVPGYQQQIASLQSQLQMLSGFMNQLQMQGMNSPAMSQMMMQISMMQEKQNQQSKEQQQKEIEALQRNQASLEVDNKLSQLRQTLQETKNVTPASTASPISQQIVLNAGSSGAEKSTRSSAFLTDEKDDSDNFWQNYRTRVATLGDTVSRIKKQIEANESNLSAAQKAVGELQQKRQLS